LSKENQEEDLRLKWEDKSTLNYMFNNKDDNAMPPPIYMAVSVLPTPDPYYVLFALISFMMVSSI